MLAGSNPAARTSQSQSPRSPYRGAGRLFSYSVRWLDGFPPTPNHEICGSPISDHSRLFNCDMQLSYIIFPPLVPFSLVDASDSSIRFAVSPPLFGLAGRNAAAFLPAFFFPIGGEARFRPAPRFPIRPIGFSPPSSPRVPSGGSVSPLLSAFLYERRGGCVFFARMSVFPVDSVAICDTLIDIHAGVVERQTRQI